MSLAVQLVYACPEPPTFSIEPTPLPRAQKRGVVVRVD
jgi:hypothetical protein